LINPQTKPLLNYQLIKRPRKMHLDVSLRFVPIWKAIFMPVIPTN